MASQGKGSAARVIMEWETAYKTLRSAANRRPIKVPFNTSELKGTRTLSQAQTIRGDRNPTTPFQGNKDAAGSITVPVDTRAFGYWLSAFFGFPTTSVETPVAEVTVGLVGSDYKAGTPTVTILSGGYTFSAAQASAKVGDRVIYTNSDGTMHVAWITAVTDSTTGTIKTDITSGSNPADVTASTVNAIMNNRQVTPGTPGTVTIGSGTATFSTPQTNLVAGQMLIYDDGTKFAWIEAVSSTTVCTVRGPNHLDHIADASTKKVQFLGAESYWTHTFKVSPTASIPSFILENGFTDLSVPYYDLFSGNKINSMELTAGGDGELIATMGVIGADNSPSGTSYDAASGAKTAPSGLFTTRFEQKHASAKEAGVTVTNLAEFKLSMVNGLDNTSFVIGGGGVRDDLPEGIAGMGGSITALFRDSSLLTKAANNTETSLQLTFVNGSESLSFLFPEVLFQQTSPPITGPAGVRFSMDYQSFYGDGANASAVVVTLVNNIKDFDMAA